MAIISSNLLHSIKEIIQQSRQRTYRMVNAVLLETYWQIGKLIVEDEQQGNEKAVYGKRTLKNLANQLTLEFGKGFDERNLNNMRAFYKNFPIWNALRTELSWTHYRLLSRIESEDKKWFYLSVLNDKNNLFATKYLLYLPKEEELKQIIEQDRIQFELNNNI
jgi:DUF1016 N-terminal domain